VRGDIDQCSYQISYISISQPVKNVQLSALYELNLLAGQTEGFLFYNTHPSSFRIMQLVSAGTANIYIFPFSQDDLTLEFVLKSDFTTFPVVDTIDGDFIVSSTSEYFCS